ncbi:MAG: hypothetical protein ACRD3W_06525 [Terriglobales bacterium]
MTWLIVVLAIFFGFGSLILTAVAAAFTAVALHGINTSIECISRRGKI